MNGSEAIAMILGSLQQNVQQIQSDVNQKGEIFATENEVPIIDLDGNLRSSKLKQVSSGVAVEGDILIQSSGKLAVGSSSNYGTTGQVLTSNSTTDSPSWETMTFTKLSDTPGDLGTSGQVAQVNSTGDALEFVNVPTYVNSAIDAAINGLINSAPGTLDTLDEIAAALGDDDDFHNTVNNAIATKQNQITTSSRLNANLVGNGDVDNTELSYLNGVTSSVQTQIDSKEDTLAANQKIPWDTDQSGNYEIHANNLPVASSSSVGAIKLGAGLSLDPFNNSTGVNVGNGITISNGVVELSEDLTTQPSGVHPVIRLEYIPLQSGGGLSKTNNELHLTDESFTSAEKTKLSGIATGAEVNVQSDWNATTGDALILNKPSLVTAFTDLTDTPANLGSTGQILQVNSGGTALEFATPSSGATTFTNLTDTPSSLGTAGQILQVNSGGTALEFVTSSVSLTNNSDANFNDVDVNGTLTINDITPSNSSTTSTVLDGTTTLSQTLTSTNQRYFGHQVKITSNSDYIFALENTASGNGPNIYIYKKISGTYSLHKTKVVNGINSTIFNTRINIKPDGSLLAVAQVDPNINQNTVYLTLYNYNSITDDWDVSNINATAIKTWGVSFNGNLQKVHEFMSPNGQYIVFSSHAAHVSGGSSGDGTVTVFNITGSGSNITVSEAIEFSHQLNSGNLYFGAESMVGISDNGYVLAYSYQNGIDSSFAGKVYLYKIDFTSNPVTATFKWSLINPASLNTVTGDAFGIMPVINEKYFAFCSYIQDNPETGSNNVGAVFVYDYNNTGSDTNPVLIKDTSTTNDYSFFGGSTTDTKHQMGQTNITIKVINSKMFIYAGSGFGRSLNQDGHGLVGIFTYDLSNGPTNSTWSNTELTLPPSAPNPSGAPYNFGLSCGISDDSIVISGPGNPFSTQPTTQIIQVRSLDGITTTNTTYATVNGTLGLNGGLALGSNADTGTTGQVLVSGGPSGVVSWGGASPDMWVLDGPASGTAAPTNGLLTSQLTQTTASGASTSGGIVTIASAGWYNVIFSCSVYNTTDGIQHIMLSIFYESGGNTPTTSSPGSQMIFIPNASYNSTTSENVNMWSESFSKVMYLAANSKVACGLQIITSGGSPIIPAGSGQLTQFAGYKIA